LLTIARIRIPKNLTDPDISWGVVKHKKGGTEIGHGKDEMREKKKGNNSE
jgi:hypothetical protein